MVQNLNYLIRRLSFSTITLIVVLIFNFFLFRIIPGDPVSMLVTPGMTRETRNRIAQSFGLDKPLWFNFDAFEKTSNPESVLDSQFFYYLRNLLRGDLGQSFRQKRPVSELLGNRIGPTFLLIVLGEILAILIGTFAGMIAAWKQGGKTDNFIIIASLTIWSLPAFFFGMMMLIMARGHLPMSGLMTPGVIYASTWEKIL